MCLRNLRTKLLLFFDICKYFCKKRKLQQVVENAGEEGIKLKDIYEYMDVTLPIGKSMAEKKRQLRYLLNLLKDEGIVSRKGLRWVFVMDTL